MEIKIDLQSIRENEDAGSTISMVRGVAECLISGSMIPLKYEADPRLYFVEKSFVVGNDFFQAKGHILGEVTDEMMQELNPFFEISIERGIEQIRHHPIPEYAFNYIDIDIKCPTCQTVSNTKQLESVLIYDEDGFECGCNFDCCPNCETPLGVKYETIEHALLRKKGAEK